jgi:hypothetical protein
MSEALSTIAMSVYNYTARSGRFITDDRLEEVRDYLARLQHPELDIETVRNAVAQLVERKLLVNSPNGFDVADHERRIVVGRNREDVSVEDDGTIQGGWDGWRVLDLMRGQVPMTEVR